MAMKLGKMVAYLEGILTIKLQHSDHVILQSQVTNKNHDISTTRVSMTTKLGAMVARLDGLLPIKSYNSLIM